MTAHGTPMDRTLKSTFEAIVGSNQYLTLATADRAGTPWSTPVWFATADFRRFVWASKPGARHSVNLRDRPQIAISIFDCSQSPGTGAGVYLSANATEVRDGEVDAMLEIYSAASRRRGLPAWSREDVQGPARHRLYQATSLECFVLDSHDERIAVPLA